jgi:hypothetical protein
MKFTPSDCTPMLMLVPIAVYRWKTPRPSDSLSDAASGAARLFGIVESVDEQALPNPTNAATASDARRRVMSIF